MSYVLLTLFMRRAGQAQQQVASKLNPSKTTGFLYSYRSISKRFMLARIVDSDGLMYT